ncbi:hypothetical protein Rin_00002110 [Candidatus Regiella insecticola 5.15]|uniref:Uncharacterized protein n=1 Tax=Candidatus Regiella insecticola 5.15 TaxID=1005043 RepID=G2GWS6_9ENTR|nr:hypothetical protein [Candidatus Regiella insecticola]EGY29802.1 hypothetical protein Rin_00002110 [Candidatus Regiella insecticola 5.15]
MKMGTVARILIIHEKINWEDIPTALEVAARRPGGETDERRHTMIASTRSQRRRNLKGEGYSG